MHIKKRKYELARPAAMTKLGPKVVHVVRGRGNNAKYRCLKAEAGNFSWGSENTTRKARILDVVYNSTSNELLRTKTLVKNAIVSVDASLFRQWYENHYGIHLGKLKDGEKLVSKTNTRVTKLQGKRVIDEAIASQFNKGRLLACISSRPGQGGRVDGYILEGAELEFYAKKLASKKK